jgi:hypothetical protein
VVEYIYKEGVNMVYELNCFPTVRDANLYYAEVEGGHYEDIVNALIADGEITIGEPTPTANDTLYGSVELRPGPGGCRRWVFVAT